jgi:hypothetical protein
VPELKTLKSEVAELSGALFSPMTATEEIVSQTLMLLMLAIGQRGHVAPTKRDAWAGEEVEALSQQSTAKRSHHRHAPICRAERDEPLLN